MTIVFFSGCGKGIEHVLQLQFIYKVPILLIWYYSSYSIMRCGIVHLSALQFHNIQ